MLIKRIKQNFEPNLAFFTKTKNMKQVVLNIPDKKYTFFMELVKSLDFVELPKDETQIKKHAEFLEGTKKSLEQVEQHLKGEINLKTAEQLYNEL